jgi:protein-S-isoprenylcysteine O-methyltransferase Ste14
MKDDHMNQTPRDAPDIIVFPPVIPVSLVLLGILLQWLVPLGLLVRVDPSWRIPPGVVMLLVGIAIAGTGRLTMMRRGTNVIPTRPALALVDDGIFKWTRNPIYVGGGFVLVGVALTFALDWVLLLFVPSMLLLHFGIILPEERYLERKFGDEYRRYKASVARYVRLG